MNFRVVALRRADSDVTHYVQRISERSVRGAVAWLDAYENLIGRLETDAASYGAANEDEYFDIELKQATFKTRHGLIYRAVYTIKDDEVRILRVRGPGQKPLEPDEIG